MLRRIITLAAALIPMLIMPYAVMAGSIGYNCAVSESSWAALNPSSCGVERATTGDTRALIILARAVEDTTDPTACYQAGWPNSLGGQLPEWADSLIADQSSQLLSSWKRESLTDYFDEMSNGRYWLWGDVYDSVLVRGSINDAPGDVVTSILTYVDTLGGGVDFSLYDTNPHDGWVDLVVVAFRYYGWWEAGWPALRCGEFTTNDSVQVEGEWVPVKICGDCTGGSGLYLQAPNEHQMTRLGAHHWWHALGGPDMLDPGDLKGGLFTEHYGDLDRFSLSSGAAAMSAVERHLVGWTDNVVITQNSTEVKIPDSVRSGLVVKRWLAGTDSTQDQYGRREAQYFLIENRQQESYYDAPLTGDCYIPDNGLPGTGIVVHHVLHDSACSDWALTRAMLESADGVWRTGGANPGELDPIAGHTHVAEYVLNDSTYWGSRADQGCMFSESTCNTFAPYTVPNSGYYGPQGEEQSWERYSGFAVVNVKSGTADTMIADFLVDIVDSLDITADAAWSGEILLATDVTVAPDAVLTIQPGTKVIAADSTDLSGQGLDSERIELIALGQLKAKGTEESEIVFQPDSSEASAPGDWYGIRLESAEADSLVWCDISYAYFGIRCDQSDNPLVDHCFLKGHEMHGLWAKGEVTLTNTKIDSCGTGGVYLTSNKLLAAPQPVLSNNLIIGRPDTSTIYGVYVTKTSRPTLADNDSIAWNHYGLWCDDQSSVTSRDDGFYSNRYYAVHVGATFTADARDSVVGNGYGLGQATGGGLYFADGSSGTVDSSRIDSNQTYGLRAASAAPTVRWSVFSGQSYHVYATGNTVPDLGDDGGSSPGRNSFDDTDVTAVVYNGTNYNLMAEANYWSQTDSLSILNLVTGQVDYSPWLGTAPSVQWGPPQGGPERRTAWLLGPCSPNPITSRSSVATVGLTIPSPGSEISLVIYDVRGRKVATLARGFFPGGFSSVSWSGLDDGGRQVASGVYYCRLEAPGVTATRTLAIVR